MFVGIPIEGTATTLIDRGVTVSLSNPVLAVAIGGLELFAVLVVRYTYTTHSTTTEE